LSVSVEYGTCLVFGNGEKLNYNQVGVMTVRVVGTAGRDVNITGSKSPNHASLTGLTPEKASKLLMPKIKNPNK
jgi:hypothetical protein